MNRDFEPEYSKERDDQSPHSSEFESQPVRPSVEGQAPMGMGLAAGTRLGFPNLQQQLKINAMQRTYGNMATLHHFGYRSQRHSETLHAGPGRSFIKSNAIEADAEHAASIAMRGATQSPFSADTAVGPLLQTKLHIACQGADDGTEAIAPTEEAVSSEEATESTEDMSSSEAGTKASLSDLIIEDDALDPGDGKMNKTSFIDQTEEAVKTVLDEELGTTAYMAARGGLLVEVMAYRQKSAGAIEKDIHKNVPGSSGAASAQEYIPMIAAKVREEVQANSGGEEEAVQGKGVNGNAVSDQDPQAIKAKLTRGRPLDGSVKTRMESAFGEDFSGVNIHTESKAAGISQNLKARAFTVGQDVSFAQNEYRPGTLAGDALIAHELAHTIQQRGTHSKSAAMQKGQSDGPLEQEADRSAIGVVASLWTGVKGFTKNLSSRIVPALQSGLKLSRCEGPDLKQLGRSLSQARGVAINKETMRQLEMLDPELAEATRQENERLGDLGEKAGECAEAVEFSMALTSLPGLAKSLPSILSLLKKGSSGLRWGANHLVKFRKHSQHMRECARRMKWGEIPTKPTTNPAAAKAMTEFCEHIVDSGHTRVGKYMTFDDCIWNKLDDAIVVRRANGEFLTFLDYSKGGVASLWDIAIPIEQLTK